MLEAEALRTADYLIVDGAEDSVDYIDLCDAEEAGYVTLPFGVFVEFYHERLTVGGFLSHRRSVVVLFESYSLFRMIKLPSLLYLSRTAA